MNELIKIRDVEVLEGYWLRLSFSDGAIKDVDLSDLMAAGRVFAPIRDRREVFERVRSIRRPGRSSGPARLTSIRTSCMATSSPLPGFTSLDAPFANVPPPTYSARPGAP
jgi:hypothetical protein